LRDPTTAQTALAMREARARLHRDASRRQSGLMSWRRCGNQVGDGQPLLSGPAKGGEASKTSQTIWNFAERLHCTGIERKERR
jgi:hypothetical protein